MIKNNKKKPKGCIFQLFLSLGRSYNLILIIVILTSVLLLKITENYLNREFEKKSEIITQNIAMNILGFEKDIEKRLLVSSMLVQEKFAKNPNLSSSDLLAISNEIGVTTISLLNGKDGKFHITSGKVFSKKDKYYSEFSLTDISQCATQMCGDSPCRNEQEIINCKIKRTTVLEAIKNPGQFYELPMFAVKIRTDNVIKTPAKWVVSYDKKSDKIFDLFYSGFDLTEILEDIIKINKHYLKYLSVTDANGNLIYDAGLNQENQIKIFKMPFGKKHTFNVENQNISYSYVLNAYFSTKEFEYQILIIRILFAIITLLIIFIILIFKATIKDKEGAVLVLKSMLKRQSFKSDKKTKPPFIN